MLDDDNPAVRALTLIPPAMLEEFRDNAEALAPVARVAWGTQLDAMLELARDPKFGNAIRLELMKHLAEVGGINKKQQATAQTGPGFSVNIVFKGPPNAPTPKAEVVDVKATTIAVDDQS